MKLRNLTLAVLVAILTLSLPSSTQAANKAAKSSGPKSKNALSQNVLWDAWYIVTVNDTVPYAYYNEKAEITDGRAHLQLRIWKKEEGFINEENIGAFSKDDAELTPLFYNYGGTYKSAQTIIDGTIDADHWLNVRVRKGGQESTPARKQVTKNTILSYMFPIWLARKISSLKQDQVTSFYALSEEAADNGFPITTGSVTLMKPDDIATKTGTKRIKVTFMDGDAFWWVKPSGFAIAINRPAGKTLIQLVPKEKALGFLK